MGFVAKRILLLCLGITIPVIREITTAPIVIITLIFKLLFFLDFLKTFFSKIPSRKSMISAKPAINKLPDIVIAALLVVIPL